VGQKPPERGGLCPFRSSPPPSSRRPRRNTAWTGPWP
jgi:hypothetical protein